MKISVDELKIIHELIIKHMEISGFEQFELDGDYYWYVSADERENFEKKPKLCVGSLQDDLNELKKIVGTQQVSIVDLDRFANVFIAIGEAISKSENPLL
jgi:hypothetical protein